MYFREKVCKLENLWYAIGFQVILISKCIIIILMYLRVYIVDHGKHNNRSPQQKSQCLRFFVLKLNPPNRKLLWNSLKLKAAPLRVYPRNTCYTDIVSNCEVCNLEIIKQDKYIKALRFEVLWKSLIILGCGHFWPSNSLRSLDTTGTRWGTSWSFHLLHHQKSATQIHATT